MRVIVTGASRGIGVGIATTLARAGHGIGLLARTEDALRTLSESLGPSAAYAVADIRVADEVADAIDALARSLGGIDALVNNAGVVVRKGIFDLTLEEWQRTLDTNLTGVFHATRAVLPRFRDQGHGHVVNIASVSGRVPLPGGSAYAASKYGLTGFSESLALELRQLGIKVTTIHPGSVDTESRRARGTAADEPAWKLTPEEIGEACLYVLETGPRNLVTSVEVRPLKPPRE